MFKKFGSTPAMQEDLTERPYAPFSTDMMNSLTACEDLTPQEEEEPETVIASNVEIVGKLTFQKLLRIDGSFEGELISSGKLIIGPTGSVKANINLEEAYISGKVIGNITVKTRLVLRGKAEITGDITAPVISVDEGVSIIGKLAVTPQSIQDLEYDASETQDF